MEDIITERGDESELVRGNLKVAWINIGEGYEGDYAADNPNDENLLRFDIIEMIDGQWTHIEDCSYCTRFPAKTIQEQKTKALKLIMDYVYDHWAAGEAIDKIAQRLSWIEPRWLRNAPIGFITGET